MAEILNIGLLGPRLRLAPEADAHDGRFELVVVRPGDRQAMVDWLRHQSPQHEPPPLLRQQFDRLQLRWPGSPARFDGKAWQPPPPREKEASVATVTAAPGSVHFLVPRVRAGT